MDEREVENLQQLKTDTGGTRVAPPFAAFGACNTRIGRTRETFVNAEREEALDTWHIMIHQRDFYLILSLNSIISL
jgi:hypothetical protein